MKLRKVFLSTSCLFLICLCGGLLVISPVLAVDKTVCKSGGCNYTSIQAAIDGATSGDRVLVTDSSSYNEAISMKDGVDVVSETGVTPTISGSSGPGVQEVVSFSGSIACNLKGFEIRNTMDGEGILMNGSGTGITATIENCNIHDNFGGAGIRLNGVVVATITGCIIHSNGDAGIVTSKPHGDQVASGSSITIKGSTVGGSGKGNLKAGVYLDGSGTGIQVIIGGSVFDDGNIISDNGEQGIRLENIDQVSIENNNISNNSQAGVLLIDVSTVSPHIKNNDIHNHVDEAGINIGGASSVTIGDNNDIYSNYAGIVFYVSTNPSLSGSASSLPVTITGNKISGNSDAGIAIRDPITGEVTVTQNDIYQNTLGGIGIQNECTVVITKNAIHNNVRGGIHTGTDIANDAFSDTTGFIGGPGSADLTVRQNKVYGNGASGYGGGIDVRHASGTIYNNLVYRNDRGGIRFGDYITEIVNNTVAHNGNDNDTPTDPDDDRGGGIIYDDLAGNVNAQPEGTLSDSPNYPNPRVRNNISAYNITTGLRVGNMPTGLTTCPGNPVYASDSMNYRDYNLVYRNNGTTDDCGWYTDTGISYARTLSCANKQYGGCGADSPYPFAMEDPHDIIADPLFVSTTEGSEDYHLQGGSPAIGTGVGGATMGAYGGSYPIDW